MELTKSKILQACLLMASMFISTATFANVVGTVIFKAGDVSVTHEDKSVITAEKNTALNAGDTIETREGRVQFSLIDGGKVSLQPNSVFKINKYEFSGKEDGSEFAFTELIKGGLRTISGLIGHKHRDRYQLKTAVATIGIRGTEFTVNFNNNELLMTTNHGSVDVCALAGGCLNAITGQTISVSGSGGPAFSSKAAKAAAAAPGGGGATFSSSDSITADGLPNSVINNLTGAVDNGGALSKSVDSALYVLNDVGNGVANGAITNATIQLSAAAKNPLQSINYNTRADFFQLSPGSFASFNSDGIVAWGQINSGTYSLTVNGNVTDTNDSLTLLDYIVGSSPNPGALATLSSGNYNVLIGSTAPFIVAGGSVGNATSIGAANTASGNLLFDFSQFSFNYSVNVTTSTLGGFQLNGAGTLVGGGSTFDSTGTSITSLAPANNCGSGCTAGLPSGSLIQGAFFGANGERVGLQYGFKVPGQGTIYGGTVFGPAGSLPAF